MSRKLYLKKVVTWFSSLKRSEKTLIAIVGCFLSLYFLTMPVLAVFDYVDENKRQINVRRVQLQDTMEHVKKYRQLDERLKSVQSTFQELQLTFQQVYEEVDRIVKDSLGNDNYLLKRASEPEALGADYQRQDFSLKIDALNLDQLVKLLYHLERGKTPLFLSKVDLAKSSFKAGEFQATLELTSVGKRQGDGEREEKSTG